MKSQEVLIHQAFAITLRSLRRRAGYSQEKLALEGGFDRSYVSVMERGRSDPGLFMLFRLAEVLEVGLLALARDIERNYFKLSEREAKRNSHT